MPETQSQEIEQLQAECAALRAVLAIVIASLHGRLDLGSVADWRDRAVHAAAARSEALAGHPAFNAALDRMRADILSLNGVQAS
jgi:TRAP-type mannitol/chloroaromatic compound transport system permease large subunit